MNPTDVRKDRLSLISSWKKNHKLTTRDKPVTNAVVNTKRNIKTETQRICLAPLTATEHQQLAIKKSRKEKKGKENLVKTENQTAVVAVPESVKIETQDSSSENSSPEPTSSIENSSPEPDSVGQITNDDTSGIDLEFSVGDIVWAYLPGYPLWPSLITISSEEGRFFKIKGGKNSKANHLFHVEFFGDNGTHSWLSLSALFAFKGTPELLLTDDNFKKHVNSKSKTFGAIQKVLKGQYRKNWPDALSGAQKCLELPQNERHEFLKGLVLSKVEEIIQRKRKSADPNNERKPKRPRQSKDIIQTQHKEIQEPQEVLMEDEESTNSSEKTDETATNDTESVQSVAKNKRENVNKDMKLVNNKVDPKMKIEVCECCGSREDRLYPCSKCRLSYHLKCINAEMEESNVDSILCLKCNPATEASCFLCKLEKEEEGQFLTCSFKLCNRSYHRHCLESFHTLCGKQERPSSTQFFCPAHYCHTCVAHLNREQQPEKKLLRCIQCPTSYHSGEMCLAAGSVQLSSTQILCPKHEDSTSQKKNHVNANWCLVCTRGGSLICCERCPASFHTNCLGMDKEPDGSYICFECLAGKAVLYGDIVWAKYAKFRWWPSRIVPPDEVPAKFPNYKPIVGEFVVEFYGSKSHAFLGRGQVFNYQEGDRGKKDSAKRSALNSQLKKAEAEALEAYKLRQLAVAQYTTERESKMNVKPPPYIRIRSNKLSKVLMSKMRGFEPFAHLMSDCLCKPEDKHPCGPDSECVNRMLLIECSNTCPAKHLCENQRFQKRLYPALYPFNTGGKGWGLKTEVDLKKGDFVIEYVGELLDHSEFLQRLKAKQDAKEESYYFLTLDKDRVIDAGPRGNLARFMNHSCQPNCQTQKWTVMGDTRVGLFALTDIAAHTELTFNYQLECAQDVANESNQRQQPCHCGAPNCAGFIGAKTKTKLDDKLTKLPKSKKKRRHRKVDKIRAEDVAEDVCFRCAEGGHLMLCDYKACNKAYHLECLNLSAPIRGQWTCPWHHCDVCGRKATRFCSICPNSLCLRHAAEANLPSDPKLGQVCNEHSKEDLEFFVKRLENVNNQVEEEVDNETGSSISS